MHLRCQGVFWRNAGGGRFWWQEDRKLRVAFQMAIHVRQVCMPRTAVATRVNPAERSLCSFILVQSIIRLANKNVMPERKLQLYGAPFHPSDRREQPAPPRRSDAPDRATRGRTSSPMTEPGWWTRAGSRTSPGALRRARPWYLPTLQMMYFFGRGGVHRITVGVTSPCWNR